MIYVNKRTGAIIDSPTSIIGGDWVQKGSDKVVSDVPSKDAFEETKQVDIQDDKNDLTKEEIMNELDALGIEYNKKAKKEELFKLMMGD
ncbi:MAG: hypothetical protein Q4E28_04975 [Clostridia bacterium]|nr:hypothetical protein [Clostridia bacterium]